MCSHRMASWSSIHILQVYKGELPNRGSKNEKYLCGPLLHLETLNETQVRLGPGERRKKKIPSRELTYPTFGKGKSSSKVPWEGICWFPGGYFLYPLIHESQNRSLGKVLFGLCECFVISLLEYLK